MEINEIYNAFLNSTQICTDSRNLVENCMFVCLKGSNFDGNEFAEDVLQRGASCVVTEKKSLSGAKGFIVVDDALATLQRLANHHRNILKTPIIGITGTNGKTTTKELINAVLSKKYKTACTKGNLNNHIGVPLTLLSIGQSDELAIVEMGANHVGEIADLCNIVQPDYGVITNIGVAHIEGFGSKENIVKTKKALYDSVISKKGTLFVNENDVLLRENLHYDKVVYYGKDAENKIVSMNPYLSIRVGDEAINTNLTGSYNIWNFLCAEKIGEYFSVPSNLIAEAMAEYKPSNHRSQVNKIGSNIVISDYYNANLTSMTAALKNINDLKHPHKVLVLGDMLELGDLSAEAHKEILQIIDNMDVEAFFVGAEFGKVATENTFATVEAANDYFKAHPVTDAMILIKGSNSIHLNRLTAILGE